MPACMFNLHVQAMPFLKKGNGSIVMIGSVAGVRPVGSSVHTAPGLNQSGRS